MPSLPTIYTSQDLTASKALSHHLSAYEPENLAVERLKLAELCLSLGAVHFRSPARQMPRAEWGPVDEL